MRLGRLLGGLFEKDSRAISAALILLLLAFAMPAFKLPRATYDFIVVFDITQSMNVEDYELNGSPVSRLAYTREAARRALRELPCGSHVGWGVFAEYRTLLLLAPIEVCANYNDLLASLGNIDGRMRWGEASEISKGVFWAVRAAKEAGSNLNVIFLSDGQEAPPLRSGEQPVFDDVKPGEIPGWLIGVGGRTPKPIPKTDADGKPVGFWRADEVIQVESDSGKGAPIQSHEHLSELREAHLQALARQVGFDYTRMTGPLSISEAMRDPRFAARRPVPTDLYWVPAIAALLLLALRFRPELRRTVD